MPKTLTQTLVAPMAHEADIERTEDYKRGMKCEWLGHKAAEMSRKELIAFVGMLDELATERARATTK